LPYGINDGKIELVNIAVAFLGFFYFCNGNTMHMDGTTVKLQADPSPASACHDRIAEGQIKKKY
jgi:hypothetical protein